MEEENIIIKEKVIQIWDGKDLPRSVGMEVKALTHNPLERDYKIWLLISLDPMKEREIKMVGQRGRIFLSVPVYVYLLDPCYFLFTLNNSFSVF